MKETEKLIDILVGGMYIVCDDYDRACRILRGIVEFKDGYWCDPTLFYSNNNIQRWVIKQVG